MGFTGIKYEHLENPEECINNWKREVSLSLNTQDMSHIMIKNICDGKPIITVGYDYNMVDPTHVYLTLTNNNCTILINWHNYNPFTKSTHGGNFHHQIEVNNPTIHTIDYVLKKYSKKLKQLLRTKEIDNMLL